MKSSRVKITARGSDKYGETAVILDVNQSTGMTQVRIVGEETTMWLKPGEFRHLSAQEVVHT